MPIIDTNILIYDTVEDSKYHKKARELLNLQDPWLIPAMVTYEWVWFFKRKNLELERVKGLLGNYLGNPKSRVLPGDDKYLRKSFKLLSKMQLPLSRFNDMIILSSAKQESRPLATFDGKLRSEARELGVKVLPET